MPHVVDGEGMTDARARAKSRPESSGHVEPAPQRPPSPIEEHARHELPYLPSLSLRRSSPGSRSFVLAALRALHLDPSHDGGEATQPRGECITTYRVATVAVARKILTLVFYGLRDGQIRCLGPVTEAA